MGFSRKPIDFNQYKAALKYAPMDVINHILLNLETEKYDLVATRKWLKKKIHKNMDLYFRHNVFESIDYGKVETALHQVMPRYKFKINSYQFVSNVYKLNVTIT